MVENLLPANAGGKAQNLGRPLLTASEFFRDSPLSLDSLDKVKKVKEGSFKKTKLELEYPSMDYLSTHRVYKNTGAITLPQQPISLRFSCDSSYLACGMAKGSMQV